MTDVFRMGRAAPILAGITQADVEACTLYHDRKPDLQAVVRKLHASKAIRLLKTREEVTLGGNTILQESDLEPIRLACFGMRQEESQIFAAKCAFAEFLHTQGYAYDAESVTAKDDKESIAERLSRILCKYYCVSHSDTRRIYFRKSPENYSLEPAMLNKAHFQVGRLPEVVELIESTSVPDYTGAMRNGANRAAATCRVLPHPPKAISNDKHVPCLCFFDLPGALDSEAASMPTPAWDEFLTRVDEPEVFLAWVFSVYKEGDSGRQAMWLLGEGSDGKSVVTKALTKPLNGSSVSLSFTESSNRFTASKVEGKRLVLIPDLKSKTFIATAFIHQLTGGDSLDIERKGEEGYEAECHSKVLICSNEEPRITADENQTSRLILIRVSPRAERGEDILWQERLEKEFPAILARAEPLYEAHSRRGRIISKKDLTQEISTTEEVLANALVQHHTLHSWAIIPESQIHLNLSSTANFDKSCPIYEKLISFKQSGAISDDQKKAMRSALTAQHSTEKSLFNLSALRNTYERKLRYQGWKKQGPMWINRAMFLEQSAKNPKLMDDLLTEYPGLFPFFGMEGIL